MRTWIVTGDKNSTAKCIGFTSGVFSRDRKIVQVDDVFANEADEKKLINKLTYEDSDLLISGKAICSLIARSNTDKVQIKSLVESFLKVKGLVVYRASPAEKAELVKLVRINKPEITTLAIGDGANDVNMI